MKEINIRDEKGTKKIGYELAEDAEAGTVIALIGDLGTGKTTLTKYIGEALGIKEPIVSPTFTIIKEYKSGRIPLYHFDVYRLMEQEEMYELGYEEYFYGDGISVVEWADKIKDLLPKDAKIIYITQGEKPEERIYKCEF